MGANNRLYLIEFLWGLNRIKWVNICKHVEQWQICWIIGEFLLWSQPFIYKSCYKMLHLVALFYGLHWPLSSQCLHHREVIQLCLDSAVKMLMMKWQSILYTEQVSWMLLIIPTVNSQIGILVLVDRFGEFQYLPNFMQLGDLRYKLRAVCHRSWCSRLPYLSAWTPGPHSSD